MNFTFNLKIKQDQIEMDVMTVKSVPNEGGLFSLPDELKDNILHYLAFQDLLNCSLVAKSWYEYIGKAEKPMKKFILCYGQTIDPITKKPKRQPKKKDAYSIQNSKRNYDTLEVTQCKRSDEVIFLPTKTWRRVQLNVGKFSSKLDYYRYVKVFLILNKVIPKIHLLQLFEFISTNVVRSENK